MQAEESIVFFDGLCNLCDRSVQFILRWDKKKKFKFASLQTEIASKLIPNYQSENTELKSIVLLQNNAIYTKSTAALRIARGLAFPINLIGIFRIVPAYMRDAIYNWIAKNRYRWFGKRESCSVPTAEMRSRFL